MKKSSNVKILSALSEKQHFRLERRYDTLARLVESNMTCAAVCVIDCTLYITTNDIYAGFSGKLKPKVSAPTTQGFSFLKKATSRFLSQEFQGKEGYTQEDREIILANFKGKSATYYKGQQGSPSLKDAELDGMIEYLLDADSTQDFMTSKSLEFFEKFIILDEGPDKKEHSPMKMSARFGKVVDVLTTFRRLWRDVRDYRKFKAMVIRGDIRIDECKILCVGQKDEHAEMRMLGYLLNKPGVFSIEKDETLVINEPLYLGISKLCCPYCVVTLNVFNENLTESEGKEESIVFQVGDESREEEVEFHSSSELLSAAEQGLEEEMKRSDALLGTRGYHPLRFNWVLPAFACQAQLKGDWPCLELNRWSDLPKKPKDQHVYIVTKGTHEVYRCKLLLPNSCITYQGKGANRRFSVSSGIVELGIPKKSFEKDKRGLKVNSKHLQSGVESYYGAGFCSQVVSLRLGDDKKTISSACELLEASNQGKEVQACLRQSKLSEQLLTVYRAESEKVVEIKGEVRMVASTSSSSVGRDEANSNEIKIFHKTARKFRDISESDEEAEHAEEGSDNISSIESDQDGGRGESEDSYESGEYDPNLKKSI